VEVKKEMEVHAQVWVEIEPPPGAMGVKVPVHVHLTGSYEAIAALLRKLKWDENLAQELKLE
jgi:hypothetical protein